MYFYVYLGLEFTVEVLRLGSYWGLPGEIESSLELKFQGFEISFLGGGT